MSLLDGLVKGISGILPQDDPDVKILNAQTELKELADKEEKTFGRFGRQVYETERRLSTVGDRETMTDLLQKPPYLSTKNIRI